MPFGIMGEGRRMRSVIAAVAEPLRRLIASDIERFGPIIKAVGVKLE
jgi:hypothetical protein